MPGMNSFSTGRTGWRGSWSSWFPWALLGCMAVFLFVRGWGRGPTFDFSSYLAAGKALASGAPLYGEDSPGRGYFLYSPVFALLFMPLAGLDPHSAYRVFLLGSLGAFLLSLLALAKVYGKGEERPSSRVLPAALAAVLLLYPLASNFKHGNSNVLVLFLLSASILTWSFGRPFLGGFPLALSVGFKVTPAVYLPWLLLRGNRRGAAGFLAGMGFWFFLLPSLFLGPARTLEETRSWAEVVLIPTVLKGDRGRPKVLAGSGESLPRIAVTLLAKGDPDLVKRKKASPIPSLGILSPGKARALGYGAALLVLLLTIWLGRKEEEPGKGGFGILAAAALLASPVSRAAHFVLLLPATVWLFGLALEGERREMLWARLTLGTAGGLMALSFLGAKAAGLPAKAFFPLACLGLPLWAGGLLVLAGRGGRCGKEVSAPEG